MTRPLKQVEQARTLQSNGLSHSAIARELGVPRSTVRDWLTGRAPDRRLSEPLDPLDLHPGYAYLLGLYLGDGCISAHPRGVFRLRLSLDRRYPGIIAEAVRAVCQTVPENRVLEQARGSWVEVSAYSRRWPELFPQHGPGPKHHRRIALAPWQEEIADLAPDLLLRGLIHSDGSRFINTGKAGWRCPRYSFANFSPGILQIFCSACDRLGLHWTTAPRTVYVSRRADVARMDEFVGPKR